jgi:hypothetical protein
MILPLIIFPAPQHLHFLALPGVPHASPRGRPAWLHQDISTHLSPSSKNFAFPGATLASSRLACPPQHLRRRGGEKPHSRSKGPPVFHHPTPHNHFLPPTKNPKPITLFFVLTAMKNLLLLILCASTLTLHAQDVRKITGKVVDNVNQKPIKDMKVSIRSRNLEATTNALGFFQLDAYATDTLFITDGTRSMKMTIPAANSFKIVFVPDPTPDESVSLEPFYSYLKKNLHYPMQPRRAGVQGAVIVYLEVDTAGVIVRKQLATESDSNLESETLKIISKTPPEQLKLLTRRYAKRYFFLPVLFGIDKKLPMPKIPDDGTVQLEPLHITVGGTSVR